MATIRWAVSVMAAGLLVGCTEKKTAESQPVAFVQGATVSIDEARTQFKSANPLSSVGIVKSTIRADQGLIAAGDLPEGGVALGDVVSIVAPDTRYTLVANGVVQSFNGPYAIVSFTDAKRAPENGDLVVRLPMMPHVTPAVAPATETPAPAPSVTPAPTTTPPATETPAPATPAPAPTTPPATDTPAPAAPPATAPPATAPAADAPAAPSTTETPKPAEGGAKPADLNK